MFSEAEIKSNDTTLIEIVELHPQEIQLLKSLRHNWRFGEVTILVRDGLPFRLLRSLTFARNDTYPQKKAPF